MPYPHASTSSATATVTEIVAGDLPVLTEKVTIASGAGALVAGTVLGKITASSKYKTSASAASDGSEAPARVLTHDVDATSADVEAIVIRRADVAADALVLGTGHTVASITDAMQDRGIFIVKRRTAGAA